jgi:hypothetical protein
MAEQWEARYGLQAVVVAIGVVKAVHADQEERCTELYGTGKVYCPGACAARLAEGERVCCEYVCTVEVLEARRHTGA